MAALKTVANQQQVALIVANWQPTKYFEKIKHLSSQNLDVNNKDLRCPQCYRLRLENTSIYAKIHGYTAFSTTMLTSSYMNTELVKNIGIKLSVQNGLRFIIPNTIDSCLYTSGFYKQNYCGCVYSLKQRLEEKYL